MDSLPELTAYGEKLEQAVLDTVGDGYMTGDLALISQLPEKHVLGLEEFLNKVAERYETL